MTTEIVDLAERALRTFGGDLSRETAGALLEMWTYSDSLSQLERYAVLDRFPRRRLEPGNSGPGG